ncbi:MAG TPA: SIR2 family protein [Thermoanaerobaculia bacterium]|nr:SIR2 family protein [Thermoanaerobaculia bacterium]
MKRAATPRRDSPYQGLTPFDERDAAYFFGRTKEARLITADLFAAPLSLLYGASGVGKSSLLRAGVLPLLRIRPEVLAVVFSEWQSDPLQRLKETILKALRRRDVKIAQPLDRFLQRCARASRRRLMIILDQFEEYSLYHPSNDEPFAQQFPAATTIGDLSVSFIVSLREEAVAGLDRFEGRIPMLFDNLRRIDHLSDAAARQAIELPLAKFTKGKVTANPNLVAEVLEQVRTGRVHLGEAGRGTTAEDRGRIEAPYLQLVMTRIWKEERADHSSSLRLETLNRLGGAPKIVQTHLNAMMDQLTAEERDIAARVFQQLVTPSGTKIAHSVSDLAQYAAVEAAKLRKILEALSKGTDRILRPVAELPERPGDPRYEIFHDRLAPAILDWRSRQVKTAEAQAAKGREAELLAAQTQSVQSFVNLALEKFGREERRIAQRLLRKLVTPEGIRVHATVKELNAEDDPLVRNVLTALQQANIIRGSEDGWLQLAHDVLIAPVMQFQTQSIRRDRTPLKHIDVRVIGQLLRGEQLSVILGSGASASDRRRANQSWHVGAPFPPTSSDLLWLLGNEVNLPPNEIERAGLSAVASFFVMEYGRERLESLLDSFFNRPYQPAPVHRFLARVAKRWPLLIGTTTFDRMMEDALRESGREFGVVSNTLERAPFFDGPVNNSGTLVYKMFGTPPSYVVTEEDDMTLFRHMSEGRLPPPQIAKKLASSHVLFLGMGLETFPQRLLLRQLRTASLENTRGFAIARNVSVADRHRWLNAGVEVFDEDIGDFVERLAYLF